MYSFSEPRDFVDLTDLDIESEWNPHYEDSPVTEPQLPSSGLLYECSFCLTSHLPAQPCNDSHYTLSLPELASYLYSTPVYEPVNQSNDLIQSNYRKWLVSVAPR